MLATETRFSLRERTIWECSDLAVLMLQQWKLALLLSFGLAFAVSAGLVIGFLLPLFPWLPALLLWWLKPLWERIILSQAGVLFFKPDASGRERGRSALRIFSWRFLLDLTVFRFSWMRTYLLPVDFFEHPEKSQRKQRRNWLRRELSGSLFGLSALFLLIEGLIGLSVWSGFLTFLGSFMAGVADDNSLMANSLVISLSYCIALLVTEPLYVLTTFAIYINRRTLHEGWDLRLAFQKLASKAHMPRKAAPMVLLLGFLILPGLGSSIQAQTTYEQKLQQVIENPEFGTTVHTHELRLKDQPDQDKNPNNPDKTISSLGNLISSQILRLVLMVVVGAFLVFLIIFIIRKLPAWRKPISAAPQQVTDPATILHRGQAGRTLSLSDALTAWNRGDQRQALASLYQAGISFAINRYQAKVPPSATESACRALVESSQAPLVFQSLFSQLTRAWISVSWSNQAMDANAFHELHQALHQHESGVKS